MLIRTVVTSYGNYPAKPQLIRDEMLRLGLAQNVTDDLVGDWVNPELLDMTHKTYLHNTLALQHGVGCHCHVEIR